MTFSMSETEKSFKVNMEDGEEEVVETKTMKEIEEEKQKEKEAQQKKDDIALVVCIFILFGLTLITIFVKVFVIDPPIDPTISTFKPLKQMIKSNEMYTGNGYLPCNGYVPCQPVFMPPEILAERIDGAMPCHDYKGLGEGPDGCF